MYFARERRGGLKAYGHNWSQLVASTAGKVSTIAAGSAKKKAARKEAAAPQGSSSSRCTLYSAGNSA